MSTDNGLICAYELDGRGSGNEVGWAEVRRWTAEAGLLWVHLDRTDPNARQWVLQDAGLDPIVCEALFAEETRPRWLAIGDGLLVILRGVNLNPGADPDDMISIRMWLDAGRILTLRSPKLKAIDDIRASLRDGNGPTNTGSFLVGLSARLLDRMSPVLEAISDQLDEMEEEVAETGNHELRRKLGVIRRQAITLRRYLAPQRDVLSHLQIEHVSWLSDLHRAQLRELCDRQMRHVEDLDAARERAAVTQEELAGRLSEQMNRTMYALSLVAGIFLPLGLLTGLLGINVGGIPGTDNDTAFTIVCVLLVALAMVAAWLFRRFRFF